ncbi:acetoacetate decarboxylase-domain-containing protein [Aspergillus californicus]
MSYIRSAEAVTAYDAYYSNPIEADAQAITVTFTTTHSFARTVVPPCFEIPNAPTGTAYICTNSERINGAYIDEDEGAAVLALDVLYEGKPGSYSLTVFVNRDMSLATGREAWGMPKKLGEIFMMGNGKKVFGVGRRRGAEIRIETTTTTTSQTEANATTVGSFYEIKTGLRAGGGPQHPAVLVEFETTQVFTHLQEGDLERTKLVIRGTPDDPMDTVPIQRLTSVGYSGYEASTRVIREVELDKDFDFRPYVYGKFYDDWPGTCRRKANEN